MDLERIESLPDFKPRLTAQEREALLSMPEGQRKLALAEDWSVMMQRDEWMMGRIHRINNSLVDFYERYSPILDFWRTVRLIVIWVIASAGGLLALAQAMKFLKPQ